MKFHRSLMVQLHDAMLSINGSWATAAWYKIYEIYKIPTSDLSPQDESLLSGLSSTSASLSWANFTECSRMAWGQQVLQCQHQGAAYSSPNKGRQLGLDPLQDGCNSSRLKKKKWHKVPAVRQGSKSLIWVVWGTQWAEGAVVYYPLYSLFSSKGLVGK